MTDRSNTTVRTRRSDQRSPDDGIRLRALSAAVYPPEESASWPGRNIEWAAPDFDIEIFDEHGDLVSYTGLVIRRARHEGANVLIAGIGAVKTHPAFRGRGLAPSAIDAALGKGVEEGCEFGLLVCEDHLVPYYERSAWCLYEGTMLTTQCGEKEPFDFNKVMVRSLGPPAPTSGILDLQGPPW